MRDFTSFYDIIKEAFGEVDNSKINSAYKIYKAAVSEEESINEFQEETIIGNIYNDLMHGATEEQAYYAATGGKHANYFDEFLEHGETQNVLKALLENGLDFKVLRGVKANQDLNLDVDLKDGRRLKIEQKVERQNGNSPVVVSFSLKVDGKEIYDWNKEKGATITTTDGYSSADVEQEIYDVQQNLIANAQNRAIDKALKTGKKRVMEKALNIIIDNTRVSVYVTHKGTIRLATRRRGSNLLSFVRKDSYLYEKTMEQLQ